MPNSRKSTRGASTRGRGRGRVSRRASTTRRNIKRGSRSHPRRHLQSGG